MTNGFHIIGAGMAGLLARSILRDQCDCVYEKQKEIPNNHNALLRFRSSIVGDAVNIPFTPVTVVKSLDTYAGNPIASMIAYSLKCNGFATLRSIESVAFRPSTEQRFIAPPDFINQLKNKGTADIHFGHKYISRQLSHPVISTVPMPALMKALEYGKPHPDFCHIHGATIVAELKNVYLCASIYITDPSFGPYRISITRNSMIIEFAFPDLKEGDFNPEDLVFHHNTLLQSLKLFGLPKDLVVSSKVKPQRYAKILPIDENERRRFILWATENFNIYSLGRFATWRPGLLLDDIVNDIRVIQHLASGRGTLYDMRKKERNYA